MVCQPQGAAARLDALAWIHPTALPAPNAFLVVEQRL